MLKAVVFFLSVIVSMNMKSLFTLLFSIMILVNIGVIFIVNHALSSFKNEEKSLLQLSEITLLGSELQQSSDNLTKFARAYAVTGDKKWQQLFDHVLAVRQGIAPPPKDHDFDYWDTLATINQVDSPHHNGSTFFERLSLAGMSTHEVAALSNAFAASERLVNIEQQAFTLANTAGTENRQKALLLLYSSEYLIEKAKIMTNIETAYQNGVDRIKASQDTASSIVAIMSRFMLIGIFTLVVLLSVSFWLLRRFYISPIEKMQNQVVSNVANQDYNFELDEDIKGELGQFSGAINSLLLNLRNELKLGHTVQSFNELLRGKTHTNDVISESKSFLSHYFGFPLITFYQLRNEQLEVIDSVGNWHDPNPNHMSLVTLCLQHKEAKSVKSSDGQPLNLAMGNVQLGLAELYFIPILANDSPLGVLQFGTSTALSTNEYRVLTDLVEAFSVAFQLSLNAEKQHEIEQEVARQLELNQHIIDSIPNPTYYRNRLGEYLGVNEQFCDFLGVTEQNVLGANIEDIFKDDVVYQLKRYELELLQGTKRIQFEITVANGNQQIRELVVYEAPFYDQNNSIMGVVGSFLDVTEHKQLERELIKAKESADNLNQIKGDFLANMSHEIRTPMNAIMGMTHMVLNTELNNKQRNYIDKIDSASNQLLGIINDILDFSKVEAGKLKIESTPFSLHQVLDNLINVLPTKAEHKPVELIFNVSPTLPNLLIGDPLRIGQVLINLVNNAIKFTEQGEIVVNIIETTRSHDTIKLDFSVVDTGIGMTHEQVSNLFKAFSQADTSTTRKFGGTGLGLSISKQLVSLMEGEIQVESHYGTGSKFNFELTLPYENQISSEYQMVSALALNKSVMLVDDNKTSRHVLSGILSGLGFAVTPAGSGREAIEQLNKHQQVFDLILMDWQMPSMDGLDTLEHIQHHKLSEESKVILLHSQSGQLQLSDDNAHQLDANLFKPITPYSLFNAIIACLGNEWQPVNLAHSNVEIPPLERLDNIDILLVEDNKTNQEIACTILESQGATITIAEHGLEALEKLEHQVFDLALMDMQMPVMDGISATKEIRKHLNSEQLPILAMTANAMQVDVQRCIEAGMDEHIAKPINVPNLIQKISLLTSLSGQSSKPSRAGITPVPCSEQLSLETFELEGVNTEQGIKTLLGDVDSYRTTLESFFKSMPIELAAMDKAIKEQNDDFIARKLHSLKGSSGTLSVNYVYQNIRTWEKAFKQGTPLQASQIEDLRQYVIRADKQLLATSTQLENAQQAEFSPQVADSAYSSTKKKTQGTRRIDAQFHQLIEQLNTALLDADTQSIELIEQLQQYQVSDPELLSKMSGFLNEFQFEQAADLLNKVKRSL
ncbi:response regulator [Vibrio tapetis]|uniref:Sensory/regulatory protein RpfC n=1 Tax=Vibrio tapetis subsp. tapetis TaxID=1671868 RepID=A0A2N8ZKD9_9VIBR|nr:response regulator [Vibrio tapetis]SON52363.1 Sensory box sensor histidine kinase/response regulator [Vibrio tapetis subsp. tapetis]